jgi:very-short-patch-repair endonuclease
MSKLEEELAFQLRLAKISGFYREFKFCPTRRWRADFAWPEARLLCEVEGGVYTRGRHLRIDGFEKDCEKYNSAALLGFFVVRVTASHIKSGKALQWIEQFLRKNGKNG